MRKYTVVGIVIIGLIIGGIYFLTNTQQKSDKEKYTECTRTAGEVYDSNRRTITRNANGYNQEEQAFYYQQTENGYRNDLNTCNEL